MNTSNLNHVLGEQLIDVRQAALMFNLPSYWLSQAKERQERRIPHYRVGKLVRFKPNDREKRAGATSMTASGTRFALN